jgi:hypothetical protein
LRKNPAWHLLNLNKDFAFVQPGAYIHTEYFSASNIRLQRSTRAATEQGATANERELTRMKNISVH